MRPYARILIVALAALVLGVFVVIAVSAVDSERNEPPAPRSEWFRRACKVPARFLELMDRGIYPRRQPDLLVLPNYPNLVGTELVSLHSGPWPFLQDVPLVFYGPGSIRSQGRVGFEHQVTLADAAPTTGALIGMPQVDQYQGRVLDKVLEPEDERDQAPKLVVTIVWDGGGWNVLSEYPDAWPNLARLMKEGSSADEAIVGSSPSVTPAVHSTLGTGTFPERHGILNIAQRMGSKLRDPFAGEQAKALVVPTLADRFDRRMDNRPLVAMVATKAWHLGMVGHGSAMEGADKDITAIADETELRLLANRDFYRLPSYLNSITDMSELAHEADIADGAIDNAWHGENLDLESGRGLFMTPTWVAHETRMVKTLIRKEGFGQDAIPDLFYINYKAIDYFQHRYTMFDPMMEKVIKGVDDSLGDLVAFLDRAVGRGNWVGIVTADHGVGLRPQDTGGWPISTDVVERHMDEEFGEGVVQTVRPTGAYVNHESLRESETTLGDVSDFLIQYTIGDAAEGSVPPEFADRVDEHLFAAAFPASYSDEILACARRHSRKS